MKRLFIILSVILLCACDSDRNKLYKLQYEQCLEMWNFYEAICKPINNSEKEHFFKYQFEYQKLEEFSNFIGSMDWDFKEETLDTLILRTCISLDSSYSQSRISTKSLAENECKKLAQFVSKDQPEENIRYMLKVHKSDEESAKAVKIILKNGLYKK